MGNKVVEKKNGNVRGYFRKTLCTELLVKFESSH